jgi:hypothetical protein
LKKSNKICNSMFFMHSQKIIKSYQKLSIFYHIPIFIDLLLPVIANSKKSFYFNFCMWIKLMLLSVWNHIFEILLQIIDDSVVFFQDIIYFKVIGISYFFICTMKLAPNSNMFVLSMSVWIEATCHNCQIWSKLKFCEYY